jgi:D-alanine--poly(phosphoribitol) ligase subunit 1
MLDILEMFSAQVSATPDVAAIIHAGNRMSYASLAQLNREMASAILSASQNTNPKVLIAVRQSPSAYAAMFGTLLTGGTFCPINVDGPVQRNIHIVRSFIPDVLLFDSSCPKEILEESSAVTHRINVDEVPRTELDSRPHECNEIAYVVFTSGSSGLPKGVKASRKAVSYVVHSEQQYYRVTTGDRWSQYSNLGYDMGIMDVFQALCHGATLVPITGPRDRVMPARAVKDSEVTIWQSVPSVLELMIQGNEVSSDLLGSLRLMIFCGEPLLPRQLEVLFDACPQLTVFNAYGATETTGFNTINQLTKDNFRASCASSTVAIGNDVQGWTVELDGDGSSEEGEIVIVGDNLSLGYWQDEERTQIAFKQRRKRSEVTRAYHTGDYGRRIDGNLYCQGRLDRQVKIRGERIELAEIDDLLRQSGYPAAYSILHDGEVHSFVECSSYVDEAQVRTQMQKELPVHALPKTISIVTNLPKNANGKVDRQELERLASGGAE